MSEVFEQLEREYSESVQAVDRAFQGVENERRRLYRDDETPRYDEREMKRRLQVLAADPDLEDAMDVYEELRERVERELTAYISQERAKAEAVGVNPLEWTYSQDVTKDVGETRAVLDALTDREAMEFLRGRVLVCKQREAVAWFLAGRARLLDHYKARGSMDDPGAVRINAEVRDVLDKLREKAMPERVVDKMVEAQERVEGLERRRADILANLPEPVRQRASRDVAASIPDWI